MGRIIISKMDFKKWDWVGLAVFMRFRVGKSGGLLWKK
jgi:hypothetical protein